MSTADIFFVLHWWIYLFIIGFVFLPVTCRIFSTFYDKGYVFSKIIGITVISYVLLLIGIAHFLPFSREEIIGVLLAFFLLLYGVPLIRKGHLRISFTTLRQFILEEILFLLGLFFLSYVRSFAPEIHGLEKYMDFGFINSILRAEYFPPKDMWFPPFSINYYYFGHFMTGILTKLSEIPAFITYNLMLATVFTFCFSGSYTIATNLYQQLYQDKKKISEVKRFFTGITTALLVTMAGNLHIIYSLFKPYANEHPVPFWKLEFQPALFPNAYWYPNATRFIHNTIHEFPIYSWTVSDLHGHVLSIPLVLLTIAVLLALFLRHFLVDNNASFNTKYINLFSTYGNSDLIKLVKSLIPTAGIENSILLSFLLAVMYMTNAWDGIIYLLLSLLVIYIISLKMRIKSVTLSQKQFIAYFTPTTKRLKQTFLQGVILFIGFIIFSLPFSLFFKPFVSGIGVLCAPKFLTNIGKIGPFLFEADHCMRSPLWQLLILHGFFYFFIISFIIFILRRKKIIVADLFITGLIIISSLLIIIPEFIYIKDIYPAHYRANTMFKLVFQSFIMLSLVSGYVIVRLLSGVKKKSSSPDWIGASWRINFYNLFFLITFLLFISVMTYPLLALKSYYGEFKTYYGLNGTNYLKTLYPSDFAAISWINRNIHGQPIILEAQGDSYTDYARVSTNTGLPTVLGWTVHEWLWRGTYDVPAPRITDIQKMYESTDLNETKKLLRIYHVQYVFIGDLERQKYTNINEQKFDILGKNVYKNGTTKIYTID